MTDIAQTTKQRRRHSSTTGHLFAIALLGGLIALAGSIAALVLWPRWPVAIAPDAPSLPIAVGGVLFNIPPAAIRVPVQRSPGTRDRLDLAFLWPSLQPPAAKPLPAGKPVATDEPPPTETGPRLKSHSIGAIPDDPKVSCRSGSAWSEPQFHFAGLSPCSSTSRSYAPVADASSISF